MNTKFPYIVKRGHAYFFRQRVPTDLAHYFKSQSLVRSLKTRNEREAIVAAQSMAAKFEQVWAELRNPATVAEYAAEGIIQDIGAKPGDLADGAPYSVIDAVLPKYVGHLTKQYGKVPPVAEMRPVDREVRRQLFNVPPAEPTHLLSQALTLYLKYHTRGKEEKFIKERERPIQYCIDAIGDKPIDQISRQDARTVCEAMLKTGMKTRSARCYLSIIGATINKARTEWELSCANNFERLDIPGEKLDDKDVPPFTAEELKAIHAACLARDDDTAWVAGILLETGARINEVAGLRADDVHLTDGPIPFVTFKGNERRPVKTDGSERSIHH